MKDETYDYIYENAISRAVRDVLNNIPEDIQKKYSLTCRKDRKQRLYLEYNNQRQNIRNKFFDTGKYDENLIDVHKVAACFVAAVLEIGMFDYDYVVPMDMRVFYSNYTVAFLVGIHILYLCILSDYERDKETEKADMLKRQRTLRFPDTNKGHDRYLQGRVKTLALNDLYAVDFDVLMYADMLYWIEMYNKKLLDDKL